MTQHHGKGLDFPQRVTGRPTLETVTSSTEKQCKDLSVFPSALYRAPAQWPLVERGLSLRTEMQMKSIFSTLNPSRPHKDLHLHVSPPSYLPQTVIHIPMFLSWKLIQHLLLHHLYPFALCPHITLTVPMHNGRAPWGLLSIKWTCPLPASSVERPWHWASINCPLNRTNLLVILENADAFH